MMMDCPQPRWQASKRLTHDRHVAGAIEGVVGAADLIGAALGHVDEVRDEIAADLLRIDEMRHAEAFAPFLFAIVDVDADDHVGAGKPQPLDHVEPDAAEPENDAFGAGLHFGSVEDRANAGRDAAADVADLVEGSVLADLGNRNLRKHREIREGGRAHVVVQLLAVEREARGAVGHDALSLRGADGRAQVGLAREARRALPAFRRVERNDVIVLFHACYARPDINDNACPLMAQNGRKEPFGVGAGQRELVGVADPGGLHLDQNLPGLWAVEVDLGDLERLRPSRMQRQHGFSWRFSSSPTNL